MQGERLLPPPFYISGIPRKRKMAKLFRPKELREFVFPELGLIMYHLFWVKYTLYLIKLGYDVSKQKHLFFGIEKNGEINPLEGVLYYSILSKLYNEKEGSDDVSVGSLWARGWLFKGGWRNVILGELEKFAKDPRNFDFVNFVDVIFHSDFYTDCKRARINLVDVIKTDMLKEFKAGNDDLESSQDAIKSFVSSITRIFLATNEIKWKEGAVIEPNIAFTQKVLLCDLDKWNDLLKIANVNFKFTREELRIFLNSLQSTEPGRYFLRSILLVSYVDPLGHNRDYVRKTMRDIYHLYESEKDFKAKVFTKFSYINLDSSVFDKIEETCFYWELNFFLADGEQLARNILCKDGETVDIINEDDIKQYFLSSKQEEATYFRKFLEKMESSKRKSFLTSLINKLRVSNNDNDSIANYFRSLLEGINRRYEPYQIFIELLLAKRTLEKETKKLYRVIVRASKERSKTSFYGIDPLMNWTRTILKALKNE
jgi:hypothetical protein